MGSRYIEVLETTQADFLRALSSRDINEKSFSLFLIINLTELQEDMDFLNPLILNNLGVVRLRGLPFRVTQEEVASFFEGLNIS